MPYAIRWFKYKLKPPNNPYEPGRTILSLLDIFLCLIRNATFHVFKRDSFFPLFIGNIWWGITTWHCGINIHETYHIIFASYEFVIRQCLCTRHSTYPKEWFHELHSIDSLSKLQIQSKRLVMTNHQAGKWEILVEVMECYPLCREDMVQTGCD